MRETYDLDFRESRSIYFFRHRLSIAELVSRNPSKTRTRSKKTDNWTRRIVNPSRSTFKPQKTRLWIAGNERNRIDSTSFFRSSNFGTEGGDAVPLLFREYSSVPTPSDSSRRVPFDCHEGSYFFSSPLSPILPFQELHFSASPEYLSRTLPTPVGTL